MLSIRQIRDWQFDFNQSPNSWKGSIFSKEKTMFVEKSVMNHCVTLLGTPTWAVFNIINVEFENLDDKTQFVSCLSSLIMMFRL